MLRGEPALGDDGGRPVRRDRHQQVKGQLGVGEHDAVRLDARGLRTHPGGNAALRELSPYPLRPVATGVRHEHRLERGNRQLGPVPEPAG